MIFDVDDADLSLWLVLDVEPAALDLVATGLGDRILDLAVEEMIRCHQRKESPAGEPWATLAPSTVKQKGSSNIGVRSGRMLDPSRWRTAPRELEPRRVGWIYPYGEDHRGRDYGQACAFHAGDSRNGQPARPLIGWTARARAEVAALIAQAIAGVEG